MRWTVPLSAAVLLVLCQGAGAMELAFDGYADLRLVVPPRGERSWLDGGLGKFRFGAAQPSPNIRFAEAAGQLVLALDDEFHLVTAARIEPDQRTGLDLLEGYASWRPQSSGSLWFSAKAGAFFPPVSLENTDLGWTSPYTLTPSAIDSWVGEELRTIGGEGTAAWSGGYGTLSAFAALYCCNEPAGVLMADRGWALDDRPTGLFERIRAPVATNLLLGEAAGNRVGEFSDIKGNVGWYGGLRWDVPEVGQLGAMRYDNRADPSAHNRQDNSWRTRFWAVSFKTEIAGAAILAQALHGDTAIADEEDPSLLYVTDFGSAYLLASYDLNEDWRLSTRAEAFQTRMHPSFGLMEEDGHAFTAAAIWNAWRWLRVTGEVLYIDSRKRERVLEGVSPEQQDAQFQLSLRAFL